MKVCVLGLWHLGSVTSACLASRGHRVVGLDFDADTVRSLAAGIPPIYEPGLEDLVKAGLRRGSLAYTTDLDTAVEGAEVVWVTFDTPVGKDDRADVDYVFDRVMAVLPAVEHQAMVLLSSQVPVGTTRRIEATAADLAATAGGRVNSLRFAYSPENLRLGKGIQNFLKPDRLVMGYREEGDRAVLEKLVRPITSRIEWMTIESAEMTKHAINAFLATSVAYINEVATLCEAVGADARQVERGLRTDTRIGPQAYLTPGSAYAGGTLARDVGFLRMVGREQGRVTPLLKGVADSNDLHKSWARQRIEDLIGDPRGQKVAIWGLAYKPGTDTLRRSSAIELCRWLLSRGAMVRVHDPVVVRLPGELASAVEMARTPLDAVEGARVLVLSTPWPTYRSLDPSEVLRKMQADPILLDPNRFLEGSYRDRRDLRYFAVGDPLRDFPQKGDAG